MLLLLLLSLGSIVDVDPVAEEACAGSDPEVNTEEFRNYDEDVVLPQVRESYKQQRISQTYDFAVRATDKYCQFGAGKGKQNTFWEMFDMLMGFVDLSDPDISLSNHQHLFQTAEGIRRDNQPDWMQFVGLAHDVGKIIHLKGGVDEDGTSMDTQWGIVGDTYFTGCQIPETIVFPEFNVLNSDMADPRYNSTHGVYTPGMGFRNAVPSFGHDEYLYRIFKHNNIDIPEQAYYMLRYHSLYPWHKEGSYEWLEDDMDKEMKPWVKLFNKYDLYTKENTKLDEAQMRERYNPIVQKYAPGVLTW